MAITFAITSVGYLKADAYHYENQVVEKINVVVLNQQTESIFDSNAVKVRIKTREGDPFSQIIFDNDLKTLAQEFDRVDPIIESVHGRLIITLRVWPKPLIRSITWKGNHRMQTKFLVKELGICSGVVFDRIAFNKAFNKLKGFYVKKGFFEAQLNYSVSLQDEANEIDVEITVDEGRSGKIQDIEFVNFTSDEQDQILEMMVTKKYKFIISFFTEEGTYNQEAIQQDEMMILTLLQNLGYADARIGITVCESSANRIIITITANRGPRYYIGKINVRGNTLYCEEELRKYFAIEEGIPYSPERIRGTGKNIMDYYGKNGYIDAFVNYEARLNCEEKVYDVDLVITEGEQFRVGLIKVFGNRSTQTKVILHETLLIPGEVFNIIKLQKTEERLLNIGFFKAVNVYAVKSQESCNLGDNYRDVHVEVEEKCTGNIGAFCGFSSNEGLFGGVNITENNFNYLGLGSLWRDGYHAVRGGGEYAHINATFGTRTSTYGLSWSKPYWKDTNWVVGFDIDRTSNRYVSKDYDIESGGFTVRAAYQINPFWRKVFHYRLRNSWVHMDHNVSKQAKDEAKNHGLISAVGVSFIYDSTNHPLMPSKGFKSRINGEFAGVGGDHTFLSFGYLNSYYFKLPKLDQKGIWKLRGDFRYIVPFAGTNVHSMPLDERLFLGGEFGLRGYRPYRVGPTFRKHHRPSDDPRGGVSLELFSVEYMYPIFSKLDAFAFFDAGHVSGEELQIGRFSSSVGYGARIKLMENSPPLTIGIGFPLNPQNRGQVKRFFFSIGGLF